MPQIDFRPVLHVLDACPFSQKALLFLSEAGLAPEFEIRRVKRGSQEERVKAEIGQKLDKVTFPVVEVESGSYLVDSDAIIERFRDGRDPASLPAFTFYVETIMPTFLRLYKENKELKAAGNS